IAESLLGELLTSFDFHNNGLFQGKTFRGRTNGPASSPTLFTSTVAGKVRLMARGIPLSEVRRVVAIMPKGREPEPPPLVRKFQVPIIYAQKWEFSSDVADIAVGEVHGSAHVETGAGEVELRVVFGTCEVDSGGGPLKLGDLMGPMDVHTDAGDVNIDKARQGGTASTDGGIVRVGYAGGPVNLSSGGGDIVVQHAAAAVDATTHSGDISITMSPVMKTNHVVAKTS